MGSGAALMIREEAYEALSEEDRAFVDQRTEKWSWYTMRASGITRRVIEVSPNCSEEDLIRIRTVGFHLLPPA
jgi:phosphoribosyl-AMP cyclohydrolase